MKRRSAGILLHLTSLPGSYGVGDLGPEARAFADWLSSAGQRWWQTLPVGPEGAGRSPYHSTSAFAGSPLLIGLGALAEAGLLGKRDIGHGPKPPPQGRADFTRAHRFRGKALRKAFAGALAGGGPQRLRGFDAWCAANQEWLDDFALFSALKRRRQGAPWSRWDGELRRREPGALERARRELAEDVAFEKFVQFEFERQWKALREYCHGRGVRLIGDIPIYVSHDSADVWAHQDQFLLDGEGRSTVVAGVPPDCFSKTGQLWGNPIYRWDAMAGHGYAWWIARLKKILDRFDAVRLDHFIGFRRYWEIPAGHETAIHGRWMPGPGEGFFERVREALGEPPLIAEDLGAMGDDVLALRDRFGFPGMRVLQFAFGSDAENPHLPHNYVPNCVVYTGTHDNDTTAGWFHGEEAPAADKETKPYQEERALALQYMGSDGREVHWDLIRLAFRSAADAAIVPAQDLLGLGAASRMNRPGKSKGNWLWRLEPGMLTEPLAARLRELTASSGRV